MVEVYLIILERSSEAAISAILNFGHLLEAWLIERLPRHKERLSYANRLALSREKSTPVNSPHWRQIFTIVWYRDSERPITETSINKKDGLIETQTGSISQQPLFHITYSPSKHADGNPTIGATLGQRTYVRLPQHRANAGKF